MDSRNSRRSDAARFRSRLFSAGIETPPYEKHASALVSDEHTHSVGGVCVCVCVCYAMYVAACVWMCGCDERVLLAGVRVFCVYVCVCTWYGMRVDVVQCVCVYVCVCVCVFVSLLV
jgi:hypothetical protein